MWEIYHSRQKDTHIRAIMESIRNLNIKRMPTISRYGQKCTVHEFLTVVNFLRKCHLQKEGEMFSYFTTPLLFCPLLISTPSVPNVLKDTDRVSMYSQFLIMNRYLSIISTRMDQNWAPRGIRPATIH
jgi:hypothetical protein